MVHLLPEQSDTKSKVKLGGFRSQLQAFYVSCRTEELWYNETVCLWMTIYVYIYMCVCVCVLIKWVRETTAHNKYHELKSSDIISKRILKASQNGYNYCQLFNKICCLPLNMIPNFAYSGSVTIRWYQEHLCIINKDLFLRRYLYKTWHALLSQVWNISK